MSRSFGSDLYARDGDLEEGGSFLRGGHPNFEEASRGVTGQNRPWSEFGPTGVRVRVENCPVCPPPITECSFTSKEALEATFSLFHVFTLRIRVTFRDSPISPKQCTTAGLCVVLLRVDFGSSGRLHAAHYRQGWPTQLQANRTSLAAPFRA